MYIRDQMLGFFEDLSEKWKDRSEYLMEDYPSIYVAIEYELLDFGA